jgi:cytochrome P450
MPILRAVVKEVIRWRQAVPSGVPHRTVEDDVYEGYSIPKGTLIHANYFTISLDEDIHPDAAEFRPERWLEPSWSTY